MTSTRIDPSGTVIRSLAAPNALQRSLLVCGVLASLLYVVTDVLGGAHYPGYSFTSQAISELAAIGAPSKEFVAPFFFAWTLLALAFSVAVFHEGRRRNRALRTTGAVLIGWVVAGQGFALFPMHRREVTALATDAPHIVTAVVVVLLMFVAISFGAFAFGRRFRFYSLITLVILIVSGAALAPYTRLLAAHEPTPGLGIVERINVYAMMLWLAALAVALLRRSGSSQAIAR